MYISTFLVRILHGIFLAKHIILNLPLSVEAAHVPNEYSVSNLCRSLFVAWLTVPALYGAIITFAIHCSWHG